MGKISFNSEFINYWVGRVDSSCTQKGLRFYQIHDSSSFLNVWTLQQANKLTSLIHCRSNLLHQQLLAPIKFKVKLFLNESENKIVWLHFKTQYHFIKDFFLIGCIVDKIFVPYFIFVLFSNSTCIFVTWSITMGINNS